MKRAVSSCRIFTLLTGDREDASEESEHAWLGFELGEVMIMKLAKNYLHPSLV